MQLCDYCIESILKSEESWDYHRCCVCFKNGLEWTASNLEGLDEAHPSRKTERCLFCSRLRQDIEKFAPELQERNGPIYRWSIRTLAKIRESLETIVVTFRQVPVEKNESGVSMEEVKLPETTFYFFPESQNLPAIEELGTSTNPEKNGGRQIKSWIDKCDADHPGCMKRRKAQPTSTQFVPTRLMDIRGPPKSDFKIIKTKETPVQSPYATLSHCWGKIPFIMLLRDNEKKFMTEGVPWKELTKNFKQAIKVARFLGIEYIWIDSLCICQGKGGDFASEGTLMHLVYRNSYCNIAIVDSLDSTGGVFRKRDPSDVAPVRYQPQERSAMFGTRAWRIVTSDLWERELLQTDLYVRGWVFQERMLAPRILHFAHHQIFWDCPSLSACETLPDGLPPPMDGIAKPDRRWRGRLQEPENGDGTLDGASDDSIDEFWRSAIRKYTNCALTKGSDKLVAMWGIAKIVRDAMGIEYGAGLWEKNLEDQLTWRVDECTLRERPSESKAWDLERPGIPSWSWASMDGPIEVPPPLTVVRHYTVTNHSGSSLCFQFASGKRPSNALKQAATDASKSELGLTTDMIKADTGDAEPELKTQWLDIQGHVGKGTLQQDHSLKKWILWVDGMNGAEIEAFPDLVPDPNQKEDWTQFFAVLSAKQVVKPIEKLVGDNESTEHEEPPIDDGDSSSYAHDILYAGVGILMKQVKDHHFHRTGAFSFRNASRDVYYKCLQATFGGEDLPSEMFDSTKGRKFWLG
ncbi:HET-domain-containing protein [Massarina eburnea CBS 473.64]|uniref:HET-domain-containing protein n=1 Tax=Massarina eburnea CBS 473.64 TaxID=1395130 RepID=A0A6A6RLX1_9PLEO|nr:HET-domain-containing protein [Massarina eburnea CBS 473.64]